MVVAYACVRCPAARYSPGSSTLAPVVNATVSANAVAVDGHDDAAFTVADVEPTVVPQRHDLVTGLEWRTLDQQCRAMKAAGGFDAGAGPSVEVVDVGPSAGQHDGVFADEAGRPPVGHQAGSGVVGVVAEGDAAVLSVGAEGDVDVAVAQFAEGLAFPGVALAPVFSQP